MAVDAIQPYYAIYTGGSGPHSASARFTNPWASRDNPASPVFILCTTKYVAGDGQKDFGIREIEYLDQNGTVQTNPPARH